VANCVKEIVILLLKRRSITVLNTCVALYSTMCRYIIYLYFIHNYVINYMYCVDVKLALWGNGVSVKEIIEIKK
jgi:hypothetical protein